MTSSDLDRSAHRRRRARGAYERAMVGAGLWRLWVLAFVIPAAALLHGGTAARTAGVAVLLGLALVLTGWRGGAWRRGALPGVLAGLPAFFVPSLVMPASTACERCAHGGNASPWMTCMSACLFTSLVAGLFLAHLARRDRDPRAYAVAAVLCAGLTASLTCSLAGGAGLAGVALGFTLSSAPVVLFTPTR